MNIVMDYRKRRTDPLYDVPFKKMVRVDANIAFGANPGPLTLSGITGTTALNNPSKPNRFVGVRGGQRPAKIEPGTNNTNGVSILGYGKSFLLTIIDLIPIKPDTPYSTALLKHYVKGSGSLYTLEDIPAEWQNWIVKATGAREGLHKELDPYNSGFNDLRNSLGHFDVTVTKLTGGHKSYTISDTYRFGYLVNDRYQRGRHGFPLGQLDDSTIKMLQKLLPSTEYQNPGGFKERWEIKKVGKETILYIPQQYLASQGREFPITGNFVR
jgi:hypothetical protein